MTPLQIATTHRYPVGSIITLGPDSLGPKVEIAGWTLHTYPIDAQGDKQEHGLCFFVKGESSDCPPSAVRFHPFVKLTEFNVVHGFTDEDHAITTEDYPYGGHRTECRWWVETAINGTQKGKQRVMQQTCNPKNGRWNRPKQSVYTDMQILYVNGESGHVLNYSFNIFFDPDGLMKFLATGMYPQLDGEEKARLHRLVKEAKASYLNLRSWFVNKFMLETARTRPDPEYVLEASKEKFRDYPYLYLKDAQTAVAAAQNEGIPFPI